VVDIETEEGWVDHAVAREFPALRLRYTVVEAGPEIPSKALRDRLKDLSTRFSGRHSMELPTKPIPAAYRIFMRQVGLDPDIHLSPVESYFSDRILRGGFLNYNSVADALTIAIVESHVALTVVDADLIELPLGIRPVRLEDESDLALGTLCIADAKGVISSLLAAPEVSNELNPHTKRTVFMAIGVEGVADWRLDDALWRVAEIARSA
jgi:DNA/RNA-binding domain of Phe-tRNA-synthetase-like protein